MAGEKDAELAGKALAGLVAYQAAERAPPRRECPVAAHAESATLRDCGGDGPPAVLVPSLINPPHILDLDPETSLAAAVAKMGRRALLLDWGPARDRQALGVGGHVEHLLLPLLRGLDGPAALVGYCLGGTMALAAAGLHPVDRVVTLAAPWRFAGYPQSSRDALAGLWRQAGPAASALGALPMEVLQSAFWSLDPERTVAKFAEFGTLEPASPTARRFVQLEDWANEGEPLPFPAARELLEDLFDADLPGNGRWTVAGKPVDGAPPVPTLHCTAGRDRITPAESAAPGETAHIAAGHVGMVVGSKRGELHAHLRSFLNPACR